MMPNAYIPMIYGPRKADFKSNEANYTLPYLEPVSAGNPLDLKLPDLQTQWARSFLHRKWTMWYLEKDRTKRWEDMQNKILTIRTIEDFWNLHYHIKPPSDLRMGCDYSLFKRGVRPMWEDAANRNGGRWVITLPRNNTAALNEIWLNVCLCLIGETLAYNNEICGCVVNIRTKNKISVWTSNGERSKAVIAIGKRLKSTLRLHKYSIEYELHADAMSKTDSLIMARYYLG